MIPVLHIEFPRGLTAIHQIEMTSQCNLRCKYCPSPNIKAGQYEKWGRWWQHMEKATYQRALEWVKFYVRQGTQRELNLAGTGESTLHPDFVEFMRLAREAVGESVHITLATNGVIHDEEMIQAIAPYRPRIWVSLHRPELAGKAVQLYKKYGLLHGVSIDPAVNANSWAGQVEWPDDDNPLPCDWLRSGKGYVLSSGAIAACCLSQGQPDSIIGHVNNEIDSVRTKPHDLCSKCYQTVAVADFDQWSGKARPGTCR